MQFSESWDGTATSVSLACRSGDVNTLNQLLKKGKAVDRIDNRGWRPIHEAAHGDHTKCLQILIKKGNSDLNWKSHEGETPLIIALKSDRRSAALTLLNAEADPNIATIHDESPLHFAVGNNMIECVEALLQAGAKVNCRDYGAETPLHIAAKSNFVEIATVLLGSGASLGETDDFGRTAIFIAAENGSIDCLKLFIERIKSVAEFNSLVEKAVRDGVTPLMIAAQNGSIECLRLLSKKGADVNRLADDGASALNLAIYCGQLECVKLLITLTRQEQRRRTCGNGYTCVLHLAIAAKKCQHELLCHFLDDGVDPNRCIIPLSDWIHSDRVSFYNPPVLPCWDNISICFDVEEIFLSLLSSAIEKNQPECVLEIIRRGGEVNPTHYFILHPLIPALLLNHLHFVRLLLDNGANPNYQSDGYRDPKILEVACTNLNGLIMVLKRGGDLRMCFPDRNPDPSHFPLFNFEHLNCLKYIINRFTGTSTNLFFKTVNRNCYWVILAQTSCRSSREMIEMSMADENGAHEGCIKLVSGINSSSLQHMCRIKIVQTVLEANKWAPVQGYLKRLPISHILINYLLYQDDQ